MGIYNPYSRRLSLNENPLVFLIIIHVVVYLLFQLVMVFFLFTLTEDAAQINFYEHIVVNIALPSPIESLVRKPWTLFTHMWYHMGFWHLLGNMLWLWMFGYIFQDMLGPRKIIPLFIITAFGGAALYIICYNVFPVLREINSLAVGASAGIMGIVVATTILAPDYRIFPMLRGGVPLWVIALIFFVIDVTLIARFSNTGGHLAHIGGGLTGMFYALALRRGKDWTDVLNRFYDWLNNLFTPVKERASVKQQLFYKTGRPPYSRTPNLTQQRIDEILDKINQRGYESLSSEEKEILKRASREDL